MVTNKPFLQGGCLGSEKQIICSGCSVLQMPDEQGEKYCIARVKKYGSAIKGQIRECNTVYIEHKIETITNQKYTRVMKN